MNLCNNDKLSMVAHDLKAFLTTIQGYADLLRDPTLKPADRANFAQKIFSAAHWMMALVNDLGELAVTEEGVLTLRQAPVDLRELTWELLGVFASLGDAKLGKVSLKTLGDSGKVMADSDRLIQVLQNLLTNAIKHAPPGGNINVTIDGSGQEVRVSVTDDGIGVDQEEQGMIFDKFYRGKNAAYQGLGLGLYIAKIIVEAHGGRIGVQSEGRGKGATFYFTLPKLNQEQDPSLDKKVIGNHTEITLFAWAHDTLRRVCAGESS